ncbi:MAG: hypothetical protein J2P43_13975 [Candidatus Dormibacteraeota bacterium]|nr:hypothetical protein [Candidatus Dormibacteraeota bacterium]
MEGAPSGPSSASAAPAESEAPAREDPATPQDTPAVTADTPWSRRGRRILVRVVVGVATILLVVGIFAVWANRQMLDPDNWAHTSGKLLEDARIRAALSNYLVDQLYANVNVSGQISSALPPRLEPLAGPISGALRDVATTAAQRTLNNSTVQAAWKAANRAAAQTLVAIVNGGHGAVSTNNGQVTLDLRTALDNLATRLGLPNIGNRLPPAAGELVILRARQIKFVQNAGKAVRGLALLMAILVPLLFVAAVLLARGHRRETLMNVGFVLIFAGLLVLLARQLLIHGVTNSLVRNDANKPAAKDVLRLATQMLKEVAGACVVVGIPLVVAGWFAGPAKWATSGRRAIAPFMREHVAWTFGIVFIVMTVIFIWQPIQATGTWLGIIVFLVLAFLGTEVLRRQVAREFPDAGQRAESFTRGG